jgi:NAD-dependent SIR2 family protein deacetylase
MTTTLTTPASLLTEFLEDHDRLFVLTGAGCSTDSGIPDYRDAEGSWKVSKPIQYGEFVGSEAVRQRYWARSFVGWRRIERAEPNEVHRSLARLEDAGKVEVLVTQNVDVLHQRAGSREVIDLHGRLDTVECLECGTSFQRQQFQDELERLNPGWFDEVEEARAAVREIRPPGAEEVVGVEKVRPDGDVELGAVEYSAFQVPPCPRCGGVLKPAVVFFGEAVPKPRVARAFEALERSDGLLVVGSSLMVWSGYRFARKAHELGIPLVILNLGKTRADDEATLKIPAQCGETLTAAVGRLGI